MTRSEVKRLQIIEKTLSGVIRQAVAAEILGITDRQVRRLVHRVKKRGPRGIIHGLRGKTSNRRLARQIQENILTIYRKKYSGFGPTLAVEKLWEQEEIKISKETLRQWLTTEGLWQARKGRRGRHLQWRERKAHCGEMVQMDGSHHAWLEERGPRLVLMGWINDATNRTYGRFYEYEGTIPALDSMKRYIKKYGIPGSIYVDRHTTYKSWAKESPVDELGNTTAKSQFEQACAKLGIRVIHANSPQAKGRVERLFKTLQDRLVKELRLAGARTLEDANAILGRFLAAHNARFCVPARENGDLHRAWPEGLDPADVFSIQTEHSLRNDNTLVHEGCWYQVITKTHAKTVVVREGLGQAERILVIGNGVKLHYRAIDGPMPRKAYVKHGYKRPKKPTGDHPWRHGFGWHLSK